MIFLYYVIVGFRLLENFIRYYDNNSVLSLRIRFKSLKSISVDSIDCMEPLRNLLAGYLPRLLSAVS